MLHNPCVRAVITIATQCWISTRAIQKGALFSGVLLHWLVSAKDKKKWRSVAPGVSAGAGPWNPVTIPVSVQYNVVMRHCYSRQLALRYSFNSACLSNMASFTAEEDNWKSLNLKRHSHISFSFFFCALTNPWYDYYCNICLSPDNYGSRAIQFHKHQGAPVGPEHICRSGQTFLHCHRPQEHPPHQRTASSRTQNHQWLQVYQATRTAVAIAISPLTECTLGAADEFALNATFWCLLGKG